MIKTLSQNAVSVAVGVVVVLAAVYYFTRKSVNAATRAVLDVNEGTPYAGYGPLGTAGNVANRVSGGTLQALGERISSWFVPEASVGADIYYTVLFPDGRRHAIHAPNVDAQGFFTYQGTRYRLGLNAAGVRLAVPQSVMAPGSGVRLPTN